MTYREPAPKPLDPPATIEEQIAAEIKAMTFGIDDQAKRDEIFSQGSFYMERYIEARLEAHRAGYGRWRLWWQHMVGASPGHGIRVQERRWAEQRHRAEHLASRNATMALLGPQVSESDDD